MAANVNDGSQLTSARGVIITMFLVFRPVRILVRALLTQSTPSQMSLGLAMGVLLGLVPKGNLLAVALGMLLAALRVNLGVAAAGALVCSVLATRFDSVFDRIGAAVLSQPDLQSFWTRLFNMPVLPWTDFNNTVVMGSFLTGLVLIWPVHRVSRPLFEHYADVLGEQARRWKLARVLLGAEWADRLGSVE